MGRSTEPVTQQERDWNSKFRHLTVLFGDAAGRCASPHRRSGARAARLLAAPDARSGELYVRRRLRYRPTSAEHVPRALRAVMEGRNVFKMALTKMPEVVHETLAKCELKLDDVKLLIPHQANLRISEACRSNSSSRRSHLQQHPALREHTARRSPSRTTSRKSGLIKQGD